MFDYFIRRLVGVLPSLLIVALVVFLFLHMLPGDPARVIAGQEAGEAQVRMIRQSLGLDRPLYEQFWRFVVNAVSWDFGTSIRTGRPVITEIASRFMPTLALTVAAMGWSTIIGLAIGIFAATRRGRWPDYAVMIFAITGISFPPFALGLLLIQAFSVELAWLPPTGYGTWQHLILPSFTLGAAVAAILARFTRSAFVEVMREDYLRTAYAKGLADRVIILKHALRNALIPVITMIGLQFGFLLGGSIVVERVFAWPGLGRLLIEAVENRDYPIIQAEILLFSFEFILINLLVDLLYAAVNPTIRYK
jgi:glutathione transport system permease protein